MKTQGFERRFSQNLAPLPRLYLTFIQQALSTNLSEQDILLILNHG